MFVPAPADSSLILRATLQMARHGASAHLLRYRTMNEPLDCWVAYQAGYALRLFELPVDDRMDLPGTGEAERQVEALLRAGRPLDAVDREALPRYKESRSGYRLKRGVQDSMSAASFSSSSASGNLML